MVRGTGSARAQEGASSKQWDLLKTSAAWTGLKDKYGPQFSILGDQLKVSIKEDGKYISMT